jgi:DNA-binding Lrp family transcriptional regulator
MSYDTEHVQNAGDNLDTITRIPAVTELLENTALASLYTAIRAESTASGPELVETVNVSKKTVYEYLRKLEQAGLISEVGKKGGASVYQAEDFELTLTIHDVAVSITPELIETVAQSDAYPVISRVHDKHGLVTLVLAHDLITAHSRGDITIRQISSLAGLSPGTTYDLVDAVYNIHQLGSETSDPTTYTPDDVPEDRTTLLSDSTDE